jgi:hypothetical protein
MRSEDYIRDSVQASPWLRRLLIILLSVTLAAGVLAGLYIENGNRQAGQLLTQYSKALQARDYAGALALYRQAQEKALDDSWLARNQNQYKEAADAIENQSLKRLKAIEDVLNSQEQLSSDDLAFAGGMAELSAVELASYLRGLCTDYLTGQIDRTLMEAAFAQLGSLANLRDAVGGLPGEFDRMTAAQPAICAALASLAEADYWTAYGGLDAVLQNDDWAGFVHEQASLYLEACQKAMYQPLLSGARDLMAGGRYLSAQSELQRLAAIFPDDAAIRETLDDCSTHVPAELAGYGGPIEMISIKPLIVDPAEAFDGDAYAVAAADSMLTTGEFSAMLEQLYANNYILIDSSRIYTADRKPAALRLPPGKKPLVLVVEGLNYYASRRMTGNCWDLVLDEGGEVAAEYQNHEGQTVVDRMGESIGILDAFVQAHPDFSLDGAKGTISLTGYECIFGQVTDADQLDDRNQALTDNGMPTVSLSDQKIAANRQGVQAVIDRLKMTGWQFASSTYGFIDARSQPMDRIQTDTEKWLAQVGSLTGPVGMLNYPNGSFITGSDERAEWLKSQGFILFTGLGTTAYLYAGSGYIYMDKTPVNGFTLRNSQTYQLGRFFDVSRVYDAAVRPK